MIRRVMGCDEPAPRPHRLFYDGKEEFTRTCPRKLMAAASPYIRAHRWSQNGNLGHLYPPGSLPAHIAEGVDLIDAMQAKRLQEKS